MCFICIYTLYNDVLSIFNFFQGGVFENFYPKKGGSLKIFTQKRGVFENFDAKKGGSLKIFEDPPTDFSRGGST